MGSPQRTKVSIFTEATYGVPQVATGGVAYQTDDAGSPSPITAHVLSDGSYAGRQGMLAEDVDTVIKGWDITIAKKLRTHGDERWMLDAVGNHDATPTVVSPATTPPTYTKEYMTDDIGPSGSYTIVLDTFTLVDGAANNLTHQTLAGCMPKSWGLSVSADNPIDISIDWIARTLVDSVSTANTTAAYPSASVGKPGAFGWQHAKLKLGASGASSAVLSAATEVNFLTSLSYSQDNHLDVGRHYIKGSTLMEQPYMMSPVTGSLEFEFQYSDTTDSEIWDKFVEGSLISAQLELERGNYKFILYIPCLHLTSATRSGSVEGATTLSATGDLRWLSGTDLVKVTYVTEGATNA